MKVRVLKKWYVDGIKEQAQQIPISLSSSLEGVAGCSEASSEYFCLSMLIILSLISWDSIGNVNFLISLLFFMARECLVVR